MDSTKPHVSSKQIFSIIYAETKKNAILSTVYLGQRNFNNREILRINILVLDKHQSKTSLSVAVFRRIRAYIEQVRGRFPDV